MPDPENLPPGGPPDDPEGEGKGGKDEDIEAPKPHLTLDPPPQEPAQSGSRPGAEPPASEPRPDQEGAQLQGLDDELARLRSLRIAGRAFHEKRRRPTNVQLILAAVTAAIFAALAIFKKDDKNPQSTPPTLSAPANPDGATPKSPESSPEEIFKAFERAERDKLFDAILSDSSMDSFLALVQSLPRTFSYLDKQNPPSRSNVGPKRYLFDLRGYADERSTSYGKFTDFIHTNSNRHLKAYFDALDKKRQELALRTQFPNNLDPFYTSIREPSHEDLEKIYRVCKILPSFIRNALLQGYEGDFKTAMTMIHDEPGLFVGKYGTGKPEREKGKLKSILGSRNKDDELVLKGERRASAVFLGKYENVSPFAKFLFRRGSSFSANLRVMLENLDQAQTPEEYADQTMTELKKMGLIKN